MAWIYYIVVGYLTGLLAVPKEDEDRPANERKNIPTARYFYSMNNISPTDLFVDRHRAWQLPTFTNLTARTASNQRGIYQPEHQATA